MMASTTQGHTDPLHIFGQSSTGQFARLIDWSQHRLGPVQTWPAELKSTLATLYRSLPPMLLLWGPEFICFYNDAFRTRLGSQKHPHAMGRRASDIWPESWSTLRAPIDRVLREGVGHYLANQPRQSFCDEEGNYDGSIREPKMSYWSQSYAPVLSENGETLGIVIHCTETTKAFIIERSLKESERRLREAIETTEEASKFSALKAKATKDSIWLWELNKNRVSWSQADGTLFGHDISLVPTTLEWWFDHIHPEDRERIEASVQSTLKADTDHWCDEYRFRKADGNYASVLDRAYLTRSSSGQPTFMVGSMQDISEQKKVEEELRLKAALLRLSVRASRIGFFHWGLAKDDLTVDSLLQQVWGFGDKAITSGAESLTLVHPDDRASVEHTIAQAIRSCEPYSFEFRLIRPIDGKALWVNVRGEVLTDENGVPQQIVGACLDITDRKMAEQDLTKREVWLRSITEAMPQIVWSSLADGTQDYANGRWFEFTGASPESAKGHNWETLVHPDDLQGAKELWQKAMQTGEPFETEYRWRHRSNNYHWVLARALPVRNEAGEIVRWMGTYTDIHPQKTLIAQLAKSEAKMKAVLSQLPVGVALTDTDGNVKTTNKVHRDVWSGDERPGIRDYNRYEGYWYDSGIRLGPEDWTMARVLREKKPFLNDLLRIRTLHGEEKVIVNSGVPIYLETGELIGGVAVVRDVTEETAIKSELKHAKEEAERANQMKSAFLANMSHEIRTPIGAILGFTELLRDPLIDPEEKKLALEVISRNGEQLTAIINDVLDLSKIEAGQISIENLKTSPKGIIEEAANILSVRAKEKGIAISLQVSPEVPQRIGTDPVRLKQIILNLLGNAVKFTRRGEVRLKAWYELEASDKASLIVDVEDTGIGLSDEQRERLFKPFSQADESMTRRFGGTGLGLVLSRRLAKALGGDVTLVKSAPGEGSCFRMRIEDRMKTAFTSIRSDAVSVSRRADEKDLSSVKVLLVEDSPDNQMLITRILKKRNADISIANNGMEGVKMALEGDFDVVLMDIQMPVMDGYTATQNLRAHGFSTPIIALTAHAMNEVQHKCLNLGCTDFLAKPINSRDLVDKVARHATCERPAVRKSPHWQS